MKPDLGELLRELLGSRRSIRKFRPEVPGHEAVERLIEAAVTAPSASNRQPWRFIVVANRDVIARLAEAVDKASNRLAELLEDSLRDAYRDYARAFSGFSTAPLLVVVLFRGEDFFSTIVEKSLPPRESSRISAIDRESAIISASLACQNLLLMAHALGLGATLMTGPLVAADAIRDLLEVQPSWELLGLVALGHPDEAPEPRPRKSASQVCRWIE